ncbi:dynamin family protein [Desulfobacterales bacterium HSG16]|nr:dynamin family protein [Desulfobacterales bacterium HSG16]
MSNLQPDNYRSLKKRLMKIAEDLSSVIPMFRSIPGIDDPSMDKLENDCCRIMEKMGEENVRVAVIGSVKSGKSTFVNSLLKGDFLKRGAGVVTCFITKIRKGQSLKARLSFKSWDQINDEIKNALNLFPDSFWNMESEPIDIQNSEHRQKLSGALHSLDASLLINHDTRSADSVLLSSCLKGYETVYPILSSGKLVHELEKNDFSKHRDFVGDDGPAAYLDDILLKIDCEHIDEDVEITDCQGSDSPNPLHLAKVQDYLLSTHLIVYVISSRTGIRQSDIRFLSMIRKMGIDDNVIFVINIDFNEHDSLDDLKNLIQRIKEDISLIRPEPEIFSFSSLYSLFSSMENKLDKKDLARFTQWKKEKDLFRFCDLENRLFMVSFQKKLTIERYSLLIKNQFEHLSRFGFGLYNRICMSRDVLKRNADDMDLITAKIGENHQKGEYMLSMIRATLDGSAASLKKELRSEIYRFFDKKRGVTGNALRFVRQYSDVQVHNDAVGGQSEDDVVVPVRMYQVYQVFKQAVDTFMVEHTNPEIFRFIVRIEKKIINYFEKVKSPYDIMAGETLAEYRLQMEKMGIQFAVSDSENFDLPGMDSIKKSFKIRLPKAESSMRYSARVKTDALMSYGYYSVIHFLKKLLKKENGGAARSKILSAEHGLIRLKKETEKSLSFYFKDYRENLTYQYLFALIDRMADVLYQSMVSRLETYTADLLSIGRQVGHDRNDREKDADVLNGLQERLEEIIEQIRELKGRLDSI